MKSAGIIAEYNPFHHGHRYHLQKTRTESRADVLIVAMSGDFTQRGDIALYDKYTRAQAAVSHGADIVVLLPFAYSCQTAELFAYGGVATLAALKIDTFSFGCENDNLTSLCKAAALLAQPPAGFDDAVRAHLQQGRSYAKARQLALSDFYEEGAALLEHPNNILAIEYLKQAALHHYALSPLAIRRVGAAHDGAAPLQGIASASFIRTLIRNGKDVNNFLPVPFENLPAADMRFFKDTLYQNLLISDADRLRRYPEIAGGLEHRMLKTLDAFTALEEYVDKTHDKHHTKSRIRRSLCHLLTDFTFTQQEIKSTPIPYIRLLAFNEAGRTYLHQLQSETMIITNLADATKHATGYAKSLLHYDLLASNLYQLATGGSMNADFFRKPIYSRE